MSDAKTHRREQSFIPPEIWGEMEAEIEGAPYTPPVEEEGAVGRTMFDLPTSEDQLVAVLQAGGDVRLGLAVGHEQVVVGIPADRKSVLPRHMAVLGTTGSGKSTSVAGLIAEAQAAGFAVVLLDVEGEYTRIHEPAG